MRVSHGWSCASKPHLPLPKTKPLKSREPIRIIYMLDPSTDGTKGLYGPSNLPWTPTALKILELTLQWIRPFVHIALCCTVTRSRAPNLISACCLTTFSLDLARNKSGTVCVQNMCLDTTECLAPHSLLTAELVVPICANPVVEHWNPQVKFPFPLQNVILVLGNRLNYLHRLLSFCACEDVTFCSPSLEKDVYTVRVTSLSPLSPSTRS